MKSLIASAFVISSLLVAPAIVVTPAMAEQCGPDAPAGHLRPGGFCDNSASGKSLTGPLDGGCDSVTYYQDFGSLETERGARIHVAVDCRIGCSTFYQGTSFKFLQPGDRLLIAEIPAECM